MVRAPQVADLHATGGVIMEGRPRFAPQTQPLSCEHQAFLSGPVPPRQCQRAGTTSTRKGPWAQLRAAKSSAPLTHPHSCLRLSQTDSWPKHRSQLPFCWELQGLPGPEVPLPSLQGTKVPGGWQEAEW